MIIPEAQQTGGLLKQCRENANLTQAQLGERVGVQAA